MYWIDSWIGNPVMDKKNWHELTTFYIANPFLAKILRYPQKIHNKPQFSMIFVHLLPGLPRSVVFFTWPDRSQTSWQRPSPAVARTSRHPRGRQRRLSAQVHSSFEGLFSPSEVVLTRPFQGLCITDSMMSAHNAVISPRLHEISTYRSSLYQIPYYSEVLSSQNPDIFVSCKVLPNTCLF